MYGDRCKHTTRGSGGAEWQPYFLEEMVAGAERTRGRGLMKQGVCVKCGQLLGLPRKSRVAEPYRHAALALMTRHNLSKVQRRLINQKLKRIDEYGFSKSKREDIFLRAFTDHSAVSENEILTTVAKI